MDVAVAIPSKSNEIYQMIEEVVKSLLSDVYSFHHDFIQTSKEPLLFAVLECLSTWQSDYPFPHSALLSLCSSLLQSIHTLNDLCTSVSTFPSSNRHAGARQQSRGRLEPSLRADSHRSADLPHDSRRIPRPSSEK